MDNKETATHFFKSLWSEVGGDVRYEVRFIGGPARSTFAKTAAGVVRAAGAARAGENVYYGVCPRTRESGRKEDVACVPALWCDLDKDVKPSEAAKLVAAYPIPPSCVINSGHGYHLYWFLTEPVMPDQFAEVERVNKAIAEIVGGDTACSDVSRILRVPCTWNVKKQPARRCAPLFDEQASFKRRAFAEHQAACPATRAAAATPAAGKPEAWAPHTEGDRNTTAFQLAARLQRAGVPEGAALAAVQAWNWNNEPPLGSEEVHAVVTGLYRRGLSIDPSPSEGCWRVADLLGLHNEEVEWVVRGLVPRRGVTMLSGEGGIGKSFFSLDLALAVATGEPWLKEFATARGPVIYADLENDEGTLGRRIGQLCAGRGTDPATIDLYVPKRGKPGVELLMDTPEGRTWLWAAICEYKPVLVVIDSLIASHTGDENSNVAMRGLMAGLDGMARDGNLALMVVHHQRKRGVVNDAGQLMRGASDLRNAIVSHLAARRLRKTDIVVEHDKCRPAQPQEAFTIALQDDKVSGGVVVRRVSTLGTQDDIGSVRERSVLERLREGACRGPELVELIGGPERSAYRVIALAVQQGKVERSKDGLYSLAREGGETNDDTGRGGSEELF